MHNLVDHKMVEKLLKTLELRDSSFYNNNFYGVYYQSILEVSKRSMRQKAAN